MKLPLPTSANKQIIINSTQSLVEKENAACKAKVNDAFASLKCDKIDSRFVELQKSCKEGIEDAKTKKEDEACSFIESKINDLVAVALKNSPQDNVNAVDINKKIYGCYIDEGKELCSEEFLTCLGENYANYANTVCDSLGK